MTNGLGIKQNLKGMKKDYCLVICKERDKIEIMIQCLIFKCPHIKKRMFKKGIVLPNLQTTRVKASIT